MLIVITGFSPASVAGNPCRVCFVETTEERARRAFAFALEEGGTDAAGACAETIRALGFDPETVPGWVGPTLKPGDVAIFRESGRWFFAEVLPN